MTFAESPNLSGPVALQLTLQQHLLIGLRCGLAGNVCKMVGREPGTIAILFFLNLYYCEILHIEGNAIIFCCRYQPVCILQLFSPQSLFKPNHPSACFQAVGFFFVFFFFAFDSTPGKMN